ncbi:P-type domain-containing protein, partial [Haematococcus lacustris]
VIGGIVEVYVLAGPSPEAVLQQYHQVVGRPALPPRWALGFHQCSADIDYMSSYRDFTFSDSFPAAEMRQWVDSLHATQQHWVPILDPGIPLLAGYEAYERGLREGLFVRDRSGQALLGEVWPGPVHWPDFLHPNTSAYWQDLLQHMHDQVPFDGLWIDMNEASNFCPGDVCHLPSGYHPATGIPSKASAPGFDTGKVEARLARKKFSARRTASLARSSWTVGKLLGLSRRRGRGRESVSALANCAIVCTQPSPDDLLSHPPYAINNQHAHLPLGWNTLAPSALHWGGVTEYDAHNLYGLSEAKV